MDAVSKHHCYYRDDSRGLWNTIRDWYLVPAHFLATLAVCLGLLLGIDGHVFAIDSQATPADRIRQSDVVTLVSAGLVVVRLLATAWLSLAGWRMGFIIMEKGGATLNQLDRLISYRIPMFRGAPDRSGPGPGPRYSRLVLVVLWLIFILATPSLFIAPLAIGAITWTPYTSENLAAAENGAKITTGGTTTSPQDPYTNFQNFQHYRNFAVQRAVGLASLAAPTDFVQGDGNPSFTSRRRIPSEINRAIGTRLGNVSVPSFVIHSLDFVQSRDDLTQGELQTLYQAGIESDFSQTNFSSDNNPLSNRDGSDIGMLATILPAPWESENMTATGDSRLDRSYSWPEAKTITASYLVMVLTHRNDTAAYETWSQCGETVSPRFGDLNHTAGWLLMNLETSLPQCYAIARVNFTAGVLECKDCPITSPGAVEYSAPRNGLQPVPDALTNTALAMMPEVLVSSAVANSSMAPTWDNLVGYTSGMLSTAYQAAWNSLSNEFALPENLAQTTTVSPPLERLQALVTHWRVYLWGVLNALVAVSGVLLAMLQRGCQHKVVQHPATAALLLDAGPVLNADAEGMCNATSLKRADGRRGVHLRVRHPEYRYHHPVLVPDGTVDKDVAISPVEPSLYKPDRWPEPEQMGTQTQTQSPIQTQMQTQTPYSPVDRTLERQQQMPEHVPERSSKRRSNVVVSPTGTTRDRDRRSERQSIPAVSPLTPAPHMHAILTDDAALFQNMAPMAGYPVGSPADSSSPTARNLDVSPYSASPTAGAGGRRWRASEALAPSKPSGNPSGKPA